MAKVSRVLVIGLGRFGTSVARSLWEGGVEVIAFDRDERVVADVKDFSHAAYVGDCVEIGILEEIGAAEVDVAIVTFGEAFEASVLCVSALTKLNVPHIVARAATPRRAEVLHAVGAHRVVQLEQEMGERMTIEIMTPAAPDLLELASHYRVLPWDVTETLAKKTLREANLRARFGVNVLGVRPRTSTKNRRLEHPTPDYVMQEGDTLLIVGEDDSVNALVDELSN